MKKYIIGGLIAMMVISTTGCATTANKQSTSSSSAVTATQVPGNTGNKPSNNQTIDEVQKSAEAGDVNAQERLGDAYFYGHDVDIDYKKAFEWADKAIKQGSTHSTIIEGVIYMNGWGEVKQDYAKALELLKQASDNKDMKAPRYIGIMYEKGYGVTVDYKEASNWYQKGSDRGDITSQLYLGALYEKGLGVQQDYSQAMKLYEKSAERGDEVAAPAMIAIGNLYEKGLGVAKDAAKAKEWYQKAVNAGYTDAQAALDRVK